MPEDLSSVANSTGVSQLVTSAIEALLAAFTRDVAAIDTPMAIPSKDGTDQGAGCCLANPLLAAGDGPHD
jgi:hypothetical protein